MLPLLEGEKPGSMGGLAQSWGHRGYGRAEGSRLGCWRPVGLMRLPLCPATPRHPSADLIHPSIQLCGDPRCGLLSSVENP